MPATPRDRSASRKAKQSPWARSPSHVSTGLALRIRSQMEKVKAIKHLVEEVPAETNQGNAAMMAAEVSSMLDLLNRHHVDFKQGHAWLVENWPATQIDHPYFANEVSVEVDRLVLKATRAISRLQAQMIMPPQADWTALRAQTCLPEMSVPQLPVPQLPVPQFPSCSDFQAMFTSVVGERKDIGDLENFQYLKGEVSGEATELVASRPPSDDSYKADWDLLAPKFENRRLVVKDHFDRLLNLKPMRERHSKSLEKMVNIINETTDTLRAFNMEDGHCFLTQFLTELLDRDTREHWEESLSTTTELPDLSELKDFLVARARALEKIERDASKSQSQLHSSWTSRRRRSPEPSRPSHSSSSSKSIRNKTSQTTTSSSSQSKAISTSSSKTSHAHSQPCASHHRRATVLSHPKPTYPCDYCGQDHFVAICPKYKNLPTLDRMEVVKLKSLCFNCLGRHNVRNCQNTRRCKHCEAPHHSLLHQADAKTFIDLFY